jgi:aminobenzoyl-glutamate transport protein
MIPSDKPSGFITRFLGGIEKVGNKLPHPATLFAMFAGLVILLSGFVSFSAFL